MTRIVKKPEDRKQEIIAAAKELFLKKEYEKTTMADVMNLLNIAKGTIYHYFNSKDDLLDAVVENTVDEYIDDLQKNLNKSKGDALTRMRLLIDAANVSHEEKEALDQLHQPGNVKFHTRLLAAMIGRTAPLFEQVIKQGCNEGHFKTDNPLESAEFLLSGIQFLTDVGFYPWNNAEYRAS